MNLQGFLTSWESEMSDLKIFTDNIEPEALNQIYTLINKNT